MTLSETKRRHAEAQRKYIKNLPPEIYVWRGMKHRCCDPGHVGYKDYGARGIIVCARWLEPHGQGFKNFLADMGPRPSPRHELDRIDPNGNYCPENCRWLPKFENRSRINGHNHYIGNQELPALNCATP